MSSLIVLCPHCLTWIEIHAQCCTECGGGVDLEDADPSPEDLDSRLGEWLLDLGGVKLSRRGWPGIGRLLASTEGLLFVPQFAEQPNGALEVDMDGTLDRPERARIRLHWWSLPVWRQPLVENHPLVMPTLPRRSLRELLCNSPGAFFMGRDSIRRISGRWGRVQIERRPSRMVSLAPVPAGAKLRDALRSLVDFAPWRTLVAEL
jgi:hypothetical protein